MMDNALERLLRDSRRATSAALPATHHINNYVIPVNIKTVRKLRKEERGKGNERRKGSANRIDV